MAQIWWFIFLGLELAKCWYSIRGPRVAMKYPSSVTFLRWWWVYRDPVFLKCCLEKETSKGSGNGHELNHLDFDTFKTWFKEWDSLQIAWGGGSFFFFRLMAQRGTRNPQMGIFTFAPQSVSSEHLSNKTQANKGWYTHRLAQKLLQGWHFRYIFPPYPLTTGPGPLKHKADEGIPFILSTDFSGSCKKW